MEEKTTTRIVHTPGTCGGRARIAGRRIRVSDVYVWYELDGMTPDEIVAEYPTITLSDVHYALAYYYDHIDEIRREMEEADAIVAEFRTTNISPWEEKRRRALPEAS